MVTNETVLPALSRRDAGPVQDSTCRRSQGSDTWAALFAEALRDAATRFVVGRRLGIWCVYDMRENTAAHFSNESYARDARTALADCVMAPDEFAWSRVNGAVEVMS